MTVNRTARGVNIGLTLGFLNKYVYKAVSISCPSRNDFLQPVYTI